MKALNLGSLNIDHVYTVPHFVQAGETLTTLRMDTFLGGKGFNQSVALAKAGAEVYHGGLLGEDGQLFLEPCREYGIHTDYMDQLEGMSGHTIIQVDADGQNSILLYPGTNRAFTKERIDSILANFGEGDYLILQNEINLVDYAIDAAYEKGMIIVLNPSPYDAYLNNCELSKVRYLLLNEVEGEMMTGCREPNAILNSLLGHYPRAGIVLTLGGEGAVYRDAQEEYRCAACRVHAVDTTAAGDTFTGYFLAAVMEGQGKREALALAAKAAAIAVTREGASPSIPYRREVEI